MSVRVAALVTCAALASAPAFAQDAPSSSAASSTAPATPPSTSTPSQAETAGAVAQESGDKPKYTRWQEAATASGIVSFVGLVIGGIGLPGIVGITAYAAGAALPQDVLLGAAVVGGSLGAAAGGTIGALPTTEWYGVPVVAASGALGSLLGLVPSFLLGHFAAEDPDLADALSPLQSAALVVAMAGAGGGAAVAGGIFALPDEGPEKADAHVSHE